VAVSAVYPGSFDPVHNGHLDLVARAASRFDRVIVAVLRNVTKAPVFDLEERVKLLAEATTDLPNVEIEPFEGLLVDFCTERGVRLIVKGLRGISDFEYEMQMAQMNSRLGDVETVFLTTGPVYSFLSSSLVKEVARFGGDVSDFVPPIVADHLARRLST
jgi:pantetheine-phosphate adenylyltransferase